MKIRIRIFFQTTITITQAIITTIIHLFSNTYFKEADTPTFVFSTQEPKNHTEEGSLSESRVVAPIANLILSYNSLYGKRKFKN